MNLRRVCLSVINCFIVAHASGADFNSAFKSGLDKVMQRYDPKLGVWADSHCVESGGCIGNQGLWYWANAANLLIDYQRFTGDKLFYAKELDTILVQNKNLVYGKSFFDDEGWWALAYIAAYQNSGNKVYLLDAERLVSDMKERGTQSICGGNGGIYWNAEKTQVGSIANELYITVNAKLYLLTHKSYYKVHAQKGWEWFKSSGLLAADGTIADHYLVTNGKCGEKINWHYSYNNGVILSGLADLYKINHNKELLKEAKIIANQGLNTFTKDGVLTETCNNPAICADDAFMFKGIFAYNLAYLASTINNNKFKTKINNYLKYNYKILMDNQGEFGNLAFIWSSPINEDKASPQYNPYDLVSELSGLYLIDANLLLQK